MSKAMKALAKRRTLFAAVLALTIFGAVYGFAATLNVGTNTLSAGNATVASCQVTGTPTGTYTTAYDTATAQYKVASVVVTGLDDTNCNGKSVSVTLTSATGGTNLATMTGLVPSSGNLTLTPGSTVSAASVTGVSVAING
ncbi:MAG TPA: hypothetical protein VLW05_00130 [Gaiellaceae bacterium]|jgi:hypothetical protein|nr:hypothetical protein [Gaiellaceae bacterium]